MPSPEVGSSCAQHSPSAELEHRNKRKRNRSNQPNRPSRKKRQLRKHRLPQDARVRLQLSQLSIFRIEPRAVQTEPVKPRLNRSWLRRRQRCKRQIAEDRDLALQLQENSGPRHNTRGSGAPPEATGGATQADTDGEAAEDSSEDSSSPDEPETGPRDWSPHTSVAQVHSFTEQPPPEPKTVIVSEVPSIICVGEPGKRHQATVIAMTVKGLGKSIREATNSAAWVPGLSLNGVANQWASERFLHFLTTSEPTMEHICMGGRKGAKAGTFMFPTTAWNSQIQSVVEEASRLAALHTDLLFARPNFVMGRLYATNGTWAHKEHTDGATASDPDRRYDPHTPVFSISTAQAPVSVWISQVPASTSIKNGPSVLLKFSEGSENDAHLWVALGAVDDQGALRVRHEVRVHNSESKLPRVALVCRTVAPYSPSTLQLHDLRQGGWLSWARDVMLNRPATAIQNDLRRGTLGDDKHSELRTLLNVHDNFGWPSGVSDRLCAEFAPAARNSTYTCGAVLSPQPQLLKHFGFHTANKGLSLGAIQFEGSWAATSLLLDFTTWTWGGTGEVLATTRYANILHLQEQPARVTCRGPAAAASGFHEIMTHSKACRRPVRILVKFNQACPPPCTQRPPNEGGRLVLALGLAEVRDCQTTLAGETNYYTLVIV